MPIANWLRPLPLNTGYHSQSAILERHHGRLFLALEQRQMVCGNVSLSTHYDVFFSKVAMVELSLQASDVGDESDDLEATPSNHAG